MTIDWDKPLEAVLEDGTTVAVELDRRLGDGDYIIVFDESVEFQAFTPDGRVWADPSEPVYLRNVAD